MTRAETRPVEIRPKESSQWFDILAYPTTLEGFQLNLVTNGPRNIKPSHQRRYDPIVQQTLKEKTGTPGFHNPIKVNLHPLPVDPQNPNVLSYNATPTQYVDFYTLSGMKRVPQELQEQVRSSGVQVVWRTTEADGSHKFVFEVRSEHAGLYPSFGGTIGGGIDGTLAFSGALTNSGMLKDASPKRIIGQGVQEAEEELGIGKVLGNMMRQSYDIQDGNLVVMSIGKDKKRNYFDVLCRGLLPIDQATLQSLYESHKTGGNDHMHDPMPKQLIFMDDKPEVYQRLLSSLTSLTPMTQAPLLLAGYMSRMEEVLKATGNQEEAQREANAWKETTAKLMHEKDRKMDQKARQERKRMTKEERRKVIKALGRVFLSAPRNKHKAFYELEHDAAKWWKGARLRPRGLSTTLTPQKQGLPKTEDALKEI